MKVVIGEEMKRIDQYTINEIGIPGIILMENAGRKIAERVMQHYPDKKFCVLIGSGNNGGDGFVIARVLKENNCDVTAYLIPEESRISGDAAYHKEIYTRSGYTFKQSGENMTAGADIIIDAMLGTGVTGDIRAPYVEIIKDLNASNKPIVSVDLPSGVPADENAVPDNALKADRTFIIQLPKVSYYTFPAREHYGEAEVVDIGIPPKAVEETSTEERRVWTIQETIASRPERAGDSHKGSYGKIGIIAGSSDMPGAAVLTTAAAVRSGAGLTTVNTHKDTFAIIAGHVPEATYYDRKDGVENFIKQKDVIAIGPGIGADEESREIVEYLIDHFEGPLIVDADGLFELDTLKDKIKNRTSPLIITPHPGEMGRLTGSSPKEVNQNRFEISREMAVDYWIYVVLKGPCTLVAVPEGNIWINDSGNTGLAKGGSGDTLTGMIAAFLGRYDNIQHAISSAVFMHGYTAEYISKQGMGIEAMTAGAIIDHLGKTFDIIDSE